MRLTKEQEWAASLWTIKDTEEIVAAIGVTSETLTQWEDQLLFKVEITEHYLKTSATTQEKQAAALVFDNCSYPETEAKIGLEEGTVIKWVQEHNSPFNRLIHEMKYGYVLDTLEMEIEEEMDNYYDSYKLNTLSEDQMLAIPLIVEGKTDAQVGEAIGKSRETINRWRNQNEDFIKDRS